MIITDLLKDCLNPTQDQLDNLKKLIVVVNSFEDYLGLKLRVTSGLRSIEHHKQIYAKLQADDIAAGRPARPIPMGSQHLKGNAVDFVSDTFAIKDLQTIFMSEEAQRHSHEVGAWFEDFKYTASWCHLQIIAPRSGKLFFIPF